MAVLDVEGGTREGLVGGEGGEGGDAEILVGSAPKVADSLGGGRGDEVPGVEVSRAVEDGLHVATLEEATHNEGADGLEGVGGVEFEGAGDEERLDGRAIRSRLRERDKTVGAVHGERVGVGVEGRREVGMHHPPQLGAEGIYVGVGQRGVVDDDVLMEIVVEHTATGEEGGERLRGEAGAGGVVEERMQPRGGRKREAIEGVFGGERVGDTESL